MSSRAVDVTAVERCARDVWRIELPTPWMRTVNAYLLTGEPLTLIDAGPGLTSSTIALRESVNELGYELADIELLIASHHHFDHMGAMRHVADVSGAEVASLSPRRSGNARRADRCSSSSPRSSAIWTCCSTTASSSNGLVTEASVFELR